METMRTLSLPSGKTIPVLGQGTWGMAEDVTRRSQEIESHRVGLSLGMSLIDTAEMYAEGAAEELVAEVIQDCRKDVFLVTKVLPHNATRKGTIAACERSLKRLKTDYIDLYLLHWKGSVPLEETVEAFESLKKTGKILNFGVSNFDVSDLDEARALSNEIVSNQVLYNLNYRGIEKDLVPYCQDKNISIMAYTPIGRDEKLLRHPLLKSIGDRYSATPIQVALAWVLRQKGVIAIPKAGQPDHVRENRAALKVKLSDGDLKELDQAFPPPKRKVPLQML